MSENENQTADANAGAPLTAEQQAQADIVATDVDAQTAQADAAGANTEGLADAMREAQAAQVAAASQAVANREGTDPSATYSGGVPGANVNVAAPAGHRVVSTYEDALEAGYLGVAPGAVNNDKMTVQAVAERDRKLGLPGTKGLDGATVNGAGGDATSNEDGTTPKTTARSRK